WVWRVSQSRKSSAGAAHMADEWYYQIFGEQFGPVTFQKLQDLVHAGTVGESDEVREGLNGPWCEWRSVAGRVAEQPVATSTAVMDSRADEGWFYESFGCEFGPISFDDLIQLAESGEIAPDDDVWLGVD